MKPYLIWALGFLTLWDTATTIYGTASMIGPKMVQIPFSILFGLVLSGYLLRSIPILKNPSTDLIPVGAKILWFFAVLYDIFTAFTGNLELIRGGQSDSSQIFIAIGLTIFICSGPIGLSQQLFGTD